MKTQDQVLKNSAREVLAWLVLTFAVLLFGITVTFAQGIPDKEDGKIRIRIEKEENGTKMKVDTTFDAKDKDKLSAYLMSLDKDFKMPPIPPIPPAPKGMVPDRRYNNARLYHLDEQDKEKLKEAMSNLRMEMKDLEQEVGGLPFDMFRDTTFPELPSFETDGEHVFSSDAMHGAAIWNKQGCCIHLNTDSQDSEENVLILDDDEPGNEQADIRVIEKRMDGDNGTQVIVLRKSRKNVDSPDKPGGESNERVNTQDGKLMAMNLESYPNPGNGKFTLKFSLDKRGDTWIRIADSSGKEVYSESRKNFSGDYSKQLDISRWGKGTYLLTITQDGQSVTKKIVVE